MNGRTGAWLRFLAASWDGVVLARRVMGWCAFRGRGQGRNRAGVRRRSPGAGESAKDSRHTAAVALRAWAVHLDEVRRTGAPKQREDQDVPDRDGKLDGADMNVRHEA